MNIHKSVLLSWFIAALVFIAAGTGVFTSLLGAESSTSAHYDFTTLRGQTVEIWGSGIYRLDSVSGASQEIAQDLVTLLIGVPLLLAAGWLTMRGSIRGKLLLTGTLGYLLYTYTSMTMLTTYNELFLLYVAIMSLCLFTFVLSLMSINLAELPAHFTAKFPRKTVAGFCFFLGVMLALLWLKVVVSSLVDGSTPAGLDNYTTLVIQAMDLGVIAPAAIVTGFLLLKRSAYGYLLASVVLVIGLTMGAALLAMVAGQIVAGVAVDVVGAVMFTILIAANSVLAVWMLRSMTDQVATDNLGTPETPSTAHGPQHHSTGGMRV